MVRAIIGLTRYARRWVQLMTTTFVLSCSYPEIEQRPSVFIQTSDDLDHLSAVSGTIKFKVLSSHTQWTLWAKNPLIGDGFITDINPTSGGSMEKINLQTDVTVLYRSNTGSLPNRQELYLQTLTSDHKIPYDTCIILIQNPHKYHL